MEPGPPPLQLSGAQTREMCTVILRTSAVCSPLLRRMIFAAGASTCVVSRTSPKPLASSRSRTVEVMSMPATESTDELAVAVASSARSVARNVGTSATTATTRLASATIMPACRRRNSAAFPLSAAMARLHPELIARPPREIRCAGSYRRIRAYGCAVEGPTREATHDGGVELTGEPRLMLTGGSAG